MGLNKRQGIDNKKSKDEDNTMNIECINEENDFQQVTFDFLEPDEKFYHNLKQLLRKTFCFVNWAFEGVLQSICDQKDFGIFLGVEDDDNPEENMIYAVLTILNLKKLNEVGFLPQFRDFIIGHCEEQVVHFLENTIFSDYPSIGLLINERVLNLPYVVVPSIYQQLMEDKRFLEEEADATDEEKAAFMFKFLIYFTVGVYRKEDDQVKDFGINNMNFAKTEDEHFIKKAVVLQKIPSPLGEEYALLFMILKYEDFIDFSYKCVA